MVGVPGGACPAHPALYGDSYLSHTPGPAFPPLTPVSRASRPLSDNSPCSPTTRTIQQLTRNAKNVHIWRIPTSTPQNTFRYRPHEQPQILKVSTQNAKTLNAKHTIRYRPHKNTFRYRPNETQEIQHHPIKAIDPCNTTNKTNTVL